jgi:hypothetical protein
MNMNGRALTTLIQETRLDRRRLLRRGGAAAGAAALLAAPTLTRAASTPQQAGEERYDVALDGRTYRALSADPTALPTTGDPFVMYGSIFPAGTFDRGNLSPDQSGAIGRWICRGIYNVDVATEAVPHVITTVLHVLGEGLSVSAGQIEQGADAIIHEGLEGGVPLTMRGIVGGYGKYAGARGEATQELRGPNETLVRLTPEIAVPVASYTFTFRFAES